MSLDCVRTVTSAQQCADSFQQYTYLQKIRQTAKVEFYPSLTYIEEARVLQARMEPRCQPQYAQSTHTEWYGDVAVSSDQRSRQHGVVPRQSMTDPLPPSSWVDIPPPRDFGAFKASNPHTNGPETATIHRTQSIGSSLRTSDAAARSAVPKPKRRPRPLDQERLRQPLDSTMLYPQLSPYDPNAESVRDTYDFYPRSVSQPTTPAYLNLQPRVVEPGMNSTALPLSQTYSPSGFGRGGREVSPANDAAFNDEHEFCLFVEATAGLGPLPGLDRRNSSVGESEHQPSDHSTSISQRSNHIVSPIAETPTTIRALQHLAQMPENTRPSPVERPQLQSFGSNFDSWLQAPPARPPLAQQHSMPQLTVFAPMDDWRNVPDVSPVEEELPDYAASQAQAHAAQRMEATRRAQELQRRWQQSGSHSIRYA